MERDLVADAEKLKAQGNEFLKQKEFDKAINYYSEAIKLNKSHVYYSNRSAAYLSKGFAETALKDAEECITLKSDWPKGYSRKGAALHQLRKYDESILAYEEGLKVDPNNQALKNGLEEVKNAQQQSSFGAGGQNPLAQLFGPDLFDKIRANPKTAAFMQDESYVQKMTAIQQNPNVLNMYMQDPMVMTTIGAMMGIDMSAAPNAGPTEEEKEARKKAELEERKKKAEEEQKKKKEAEEAAFNALSDGQKKALEHKKKGNELYKKREFEAAVKEYDAAIEADPKEMTYHTNKAAVLLEMKDLEGCVKQCEKAIEVGRANHAPYETIAKAFARMGNAYYKNKQWENAIKHYQSAQLEAKASDVARKLKKAQLELKKEKDMAYRDPEKAAEAKERGNEKFKASDFPGAIEEYTEAVKRDPENAVYYANRAAAYTKMMDFGRANDDCNKALELNPKYVKAFSRRGAIEFFRKEYHKAMETYRKGLEIDPNNAELQQGLQKTMQAVRSSDGENNQQRAQRAMEDPEIRSIMQDPVMTQVLRDMSTDPAAAQKHMRDPAVAAKIEKLIAAGIVQTR